jgi:DNA (cytosine-5)-methyltransferase 1
VQVPSSEKIVDPKRHLTCSCLSDPGILILRMIPVIDLFAGPGGLGEGFSARRDAHDDPVFKIALSVEKDPFAYETLKLRSFFRQFRRRDIPEEYYEHLRGRIDRNQLYSYFPAQATTANVETWNAELGNNRQWPASKIDQRISKALAGAENWVLIGGPPCQAYSLVGRSRVIPVDRREGTQNYENDKRHFLYKAYLRIIAEHSPPVFVMENVKGILSAEVGGKRIIDRLLADLRHPTPAARGEDGAENGGLEYRIYPVTDGSGTRGLFDTDSETRPSDYVVRSEEHRIPQARHRMILLGVRKDIAKKPTSLRVYRDRIRMWAAICDLPRLRSRLSNGHDSAATWVQTIRKLADADAMLDPIVDDFVHRTVFAKLNQLAGRLSPGDAFLEWTRQPVFQREWFYDPRLGGVCNHVSRSHMDSDLWRYFFSACYATVHKKSPTLSDFPASLLPTHRNVNKVRADDFVFKDRFRVQVRNRPATTVTCHIGKDGHYFIHPDPLQCRSLTVREAARLQTFPDNYFFAGPTTQQYQQVGNAVPPLLAMRIAAVVSGLFA